MKKLINMANQEKSITCQQTKQMKEESCRNEVTSTNNDNWKS